MDDIDIVSNERFVTFLDLFNFYETLNEMIDNKLGLVEINNFNRLKSNVYNLGLSSANLSKYMLAKKIKQKLKYLKIKIIKNIKDPDQRDYYISNKKIEKKGFKAKIKIESGINELIKVFNNTKGNTINNY